MKSCPQGHAAAAGPLPGAPDGEDPVPAAEEGDHPEWLAEVLKKDPPLDGMKKAQLLKLGWTTVKGNPRIKVAHKPKTFRTPAPRFPRHRIRTTWGFIAGDWKLLEDKVSMDELDAVYGDVPEGTVIMVTIFDLPEDEDEETPDSDVEVHVLKGRQNEEALRAEAKTVQHMLSHRPKNPFCPVCQRAKMYAPHARKRGGWSTVHSKSFGDHITIDHIITRDAKDYGFEGQTVAHVVKDVFTKFRYVYPSDNKSGEKCYEDLLHFLQVDDTVKVVYSDNANEFDYAVKLLQARHNTSREYVDQNKAVIEREIRTILEGTRANLVQAGLPDKLWPLASQHHAMSLNVSKRFDNNLVPWSQRFGEEFTGKLVPFGAKILYWADPKQKQPNRSKFAGTGIEGIFLGYHIQPGFIFKEEYLVAPLQGIQEAIENDAFRTFRAKRLELLDGDFVFPLAPAHQALGNQKPPELDDQHHNAIEDKDPHHEEPDSAYGVGRISDDEDEADEHPAGGSWDDVVYPERYDPLDDVPAPIKAKLSKAAPSCRPGEDIGVPYGQTYTTCTTALVELATPVSDASRGSQRVEVSTTPARMARLVASGDGFMCDTGRPGDMVALQYHLNGIVQGGLNAEFLALGDTDEHLMIRNSYEAFPPQTIASLSFSDEEAPSPFLYKLSCVSDEGLAKLRPIAKEHRNEYLLVVTDSVSSLGRQNNKGKWKYSTIENEIIAVGQASRYVDQKYHMCWGKTLSWLTWQVQESVKEIKGRDASALIDVVIWWNGNEVVGRRGCVPSRLAPGAAFEDAAFLADPESVARKIRRCADALATLAGEPSTGFVRILGNASHECYDLHPAYNPFLEQMFLEFKSRGLQTQCTTAIASNLEYYDSFHLRDTPDNRKKLQSYLQAAINLAGWEWRAQSYASVLDRLIDMFPYVEPEEGHRLNSPPAREALRLYKELIEEPRKRMLAEKVKPAPAKDITPADRWWEIPNADGVDEEGEAESEQEDKEVEAVDLELPVVSDLSSIAAIQNHIVIEDETGKVEYVEPETVTLVDEEEHRAPLSSGPGRATSSVATRKGVPSGARDDADRREMYEPVGSMHGTAEQWSGDQPCDRYWCGGSMYALELIGQQDLTYYAQKANFKHGDLKLLTKMLRGHENERYQLVFDVALWTDVDAVLGLFNNVTGRRWGVRQLLQVAAQDRKNRFEIMGVPVPAAESLGLSLFPVRVRVVSGHNKKILRGESDQYLAKTFFSAENLQDAPEILYHRTTQDTVDRILRQGFKPGGGKAHGRAHSYFSATQIKDEVYTSGLRSTYPMQFTVNCREAIQDGVIFFETANKGILTRQLVPASCIMSCIDTKTGEIIFARVETEDATTSEQATRKGEPSSSSTAIFPKAAPAEAEHMASPSTPKGSVGRFIEAKRARLEADPAAAGDIDAEDTEMVEIEVDTSEAEEESFASLPGQRFCMECGTSQKGRENKTDRQAMENLNVRRAALAALRLPADRETSLGRTSGRWRRNTPSPGDLYPSKLPSFVTRKTS